MRRWIEVRSLSERAHRGEYEIREEVTKTKETKGRKETVTKNEANEIKNQITVWRASEMWLVAGAPPNIELGLVPWQHVQ